MNEIDFDAKKNHNLVSIFNPIEKELTLMQFGYNNLKYITPFKFFRKQPFFTLHFVLDGKGKLVYDGKEFIVDVNSFFILPPNKDIMYYPMEQHPWKYCWFVFTGENAKVYYENVLFANKEVAFKIKDYEIIFFIKKLVSDLIANRNIKHYKALSAFYYIYENITQLKKEENNSNVFIDNAINCISLNAFNQDFSVEVLSNMIHVSHSYLCSIFKKKFNVCVKEYITNIRLERAKELIQNSHYRIKEIAYMVGYKDEINFTKAFKKKYLTSPISFRNNKD